MALQGKKRKRKRVLTDSGHTVYERGTEFCYLIGEIISIPAKEQKLC
jgi:hypothetical protein